MSQETLGVSGTNTKPEARHILKHFRKPIITLASLIAIGSVACGDTTNQTQNLDRASILPIPSETTIKPISTPAAQPWTLVPENANAPTPTIKPPEAPIPTNPPEPTPTPDPTPKPDIKYLKPGESVSVTYFIPSQSGKPATRFLDLVFENGDSENLKKEIRIPTLSQEVFQEEKEITIPQGGANVTAIITVLPGANSTCFDEINLFEYSRDTGFTDLPINKVTLGKNVCITDSLQVFFSNQRVIGRDVFSDIIFLNAAGEEQEVIFWVPEEKCYKAGQRDFLQDNKRMVELRVKIPARRPDTNYGISGATMRTILKFDEKNDPLPTCSIEFNPVLKD